MNIRKGYIVIFIVSVLGLAFIQFQYLRIGLNLAKVQFNQKIGQTAERIKTELQVENELTFLMGKAMMKDDSYFNLSLDSLQDASKHFLNDFLENHLMLNGVKVDFDYELYSRDSVHYLESPGFDNTKESDLKYPIELAGYLPKLTGKKLVLELEFTDVNEYFLFQLNGLTIPSIIFIIAIIVVVIWVLRSFYWQRNVITTTNDFINNLTHELKTPVFSIGLATKMLAEKGSAQTQPYVDIIKEQNDRLKVHIENVLDLAGMERNKRIIKLVQIDFYPVLLGLCQEFTRLAAMENVKFSYELKGNTYPLKCQPNHLSNAVNNVLENAKKYTPIDPIISLSARIEGQKLVIEITDNGIGIQKKDIPLIFKKFHRISSGDVQSVRGYGLGLSYVKQVVDSHKGKVKVQSEPGQGTTVIIKLPISENGKS